MTCPTPYTGVLFFMKLISDIMSITKNWQHHSKKQQKRKLKPAALRAAKARRAALKRKLYAP